MPKIPNIPIRLRPGNQGARSGNRQGQHHDAQAARCGTERHPEVAMAQATLAYRAQRMDDAMCWCVVAMLDFWALATLEQRQSARERLRQSLADELQARDSEDM